MLDRLQNSRKPHLYLKIVMVIAEGETFLILPYKRMTIESLFRYQSTYNSITLSNSCYIPEATDGVSYLSRHANSGVVIRYSTLRTYSSALIFFLFCNFLKDFFAFSYTANHC